MTQQMPGTSAVQAFINTRNMRQKQVQDQQRRNLLGEMLMGGSGEGLAQVDPEAYMMGRQFQAQQAQAQQQQEKNALIQDLRQQYAATQDPEALRRLMVVDPESSAAMRKQLGDMDEVGTQNAINQATALARLVKSNPDGAMNYYNQNLSGNPAFEGLADELQNGDYEGVLQGLGVGITALGGQEAYEEAFGEPAGGPEIGTYNPRDYTVESFNRFQQTGDPGVLERYEPSKTVEIGGVPHVFNPANQEWQPVRIPRETGDEEVTTDTVAESEAEIAGAKATATGQAAQEVEEMSPAAQERRRLQEQEATRTLDLVDRLLESESLGRISGAETAVPLVGSIQAATARDELNDLKALGNLLTMGNLGRMTGVLSESDIRLISNAASGMEIGDSGTPISETALRRNLRDIRQRIRDGIQKRSEQQGEAPSPGADGEGANAPSQQNRMTEQSADDFINSVLGGQ